MMNLSPHHRFRIPNGLAIFAALLLLVSSVEGFKANRETHTAGQDSTPSITNDRVESGGVNDTSRRKSRGLNLGLLLFRRG